MRFSDSSVVLERPLDGAALRELVAVMGAHLGWDEARRSAEYDRLTDRFRRLHRIEIPETDARSRFA